MFLDKPRENGWVSNKSLLDRGVSGENDDRYGHSNLTSEIPSFCLVQSEIRDAKPYHPTARESTRQPESVQGKVPEDLVQLT